MKNLFFAAIIAVSLTTVNAQEVEFAATAGYLNASGKVKTSGLSVSASQSGFYVGGVADFTLSEVLHIQSELLFANVGGDSGIIIPIMAKYYVTDAINIQAGPHFDIAAGSLPTDFTSLGISLGAGLGYDINEEYFVEARYSFQLNDYYTGDLDIKSTTNSLLVGVGYKF